MTKLTATTITDEQIGSLLDSCDVTARPDDRSIVDDCYMATSTLRPRARAAARGRLAAIINARRRGEEAVRHLPPSHLHILRAVANGIVYRSESHRDLYESYESLGAGKQRKVTVLINKLYGDGLVGTETGASRWRRAWVLTPAGSKALDQHGAVQP